MTFKRLYELKDISAKNGNSKDCYFEDLNELIGRENLYYTKLANELNRLDESSWKFLKKEISHELCIKNNKRGWAQLFSKLNEAKGYGHLLDKGCNKVNFIPKSQKNGVETPDLIVMDNEITFLCEVKTINKSDCEIQRRKDRSTKEVGFELNDGLKSQLDKVIIKAKSQLANYPNSNVMSKIVYVLLDNDDWQPEAKEALYPEIISYIQKFNEDGVEIEIKLT